MQRAHVALQYTCIDIHKHIKAKINANIYDLTQQKSTNIWCMFVAEFLQRMLNRNN